MVDAIYLDWREIIIGASLDGEKKMIWRHQGVIMRIQRIAKPGFMRVWCGAHQLDFCIQLFYLAIPTRFLNIYINRSVSSSAAEMFSFATPTG